MSVEPRVGGTSRRKMAIPRLGSRAPPALRRSSLSQLVLGPPCRAKDSPVTAVRGLENRVSALSFCSDKFLPFQLLFQHPSDGIEDETLRWSSLPTLLIDSCRRPPGSCLRTFLCDRYTEGLLKLQAPLFHAVLSRHSCPWIRVLLHNDLKGSTYEAWEC